MTQSILAGAEIKRWKLKGKKVGVSASVAIALLYRSSPETRRHESPAGRTYPDRGEFESLRRFPGAIRATLTAPADARAITQGFHYVVYGPDLRIPICNGFCCAPFGNCQAATGRRPLKAMAEALKIVHTDKAFVYKILGKSARGRQENP